MIGKEHGIFVIKRWGCSLGSEAFFDKRRVEWVLSCGGEVEAVLIWGGSGCGCVDRWLCARSPFLFSFGGEDALVGVLVIRALFSNVSFILVSFPSRHSGFNG